MTEKPYTFQPRGCLRSHELLRYGHKRVFECQHIPNKTLLTEYAADRPDKYLVILKHLASISMNAEAYQLSRVIVRAMKNWVG